MCVSHQLLLGQRWQNLRVQLHGQPGNAPRACTVPAWLCCAPACCGSVQAPVRVRCIGLRCIALGCGALGCGALGCGAGNASLLWHFAARADCGCGVQLWGAAALPVAQRWDPGLVQVGVLRYRSVWDGTVWRSEAFAGGGGFLGVSPSHLGSPSELPSWICSRSVAVCLQERQMHPFLVEMRHRGRLRGPFR